MTREEKIDTINDLNRENKDILNVIRGFDKNNPDDIYMELRRPDFNFGYGVRIKDEILMTVVEMLENKIEKNNKKLDELLGVEE